MNKVISLPQVIWPDLLDLKIAVPEVARPSEAHLQSYLVDKQYSLAQSTKADGQLAEGQRIVFHLYATDLKNNILPKTTHLKMIGLLRPDLISKGFYEALLDHKVGDKGQVQLALPKSLGTPTDQGKPCFLHYHILEAHSLDKPPIDATLPQKLDYESYESLFQAMALELLEQRQIDWYKGVKRQLVHSVIDQAEISGEAAQELFKAELIAQWEEKEEPGLLEMGVDTVDIDQSFETWCHHSEIQKEVWIALKTSLVLKDLIAKENIVLSEEEILEQAQMGAETFDKPLNEIIKILDEQNSLGPLVQKLALEKAVDWLMDRASLEIINADD